MVEGGAGDKRWIDGLGWERGEEETLRVGRMSGRMMSRMGPDDGPDDRPNLQGIRVIRVGESQSRRAFKLPRAHPASGLGPTGGRLGSKIDSDPSQNQIRERLGSGIDSDPR